MPIIPSAWMGGIQEWIRQTANAINPVVRNWPDFGTTGTIGYVTGAGGAVTQATNKATGVTLNASCGRITMNAAALNAGTAVSFTLTNSRIAAGDLLILNHASAGTAGAYTLNGQAGSGSAVITVRNVTAGNLSEAIVIGFAVIKGVTA